MIALAKIINFLPQNVSKLIIFSTVSLGFINRYFFDRLITRPWDIPYFQTVFSDIKTKTSILSL